MIDAKRTGQKLKATCEQHGINVTRIQEELHIGAFQSIYNWFGGKTLPSLDNFYALSRLLNVSMESLIVEAEANKKVIECFVLNIQQGKSREKECYKRLYQYLRKTQRIAA